MTRPLTIRRDGRVDRSSKSPPTCSLARQVSPEDGNNGNHNGNGQPGQFGLEVGGVVGVRLRVACNLQMRCHAVKPSGDEPTPSTLQVCRAIQNSPVTAGHVEPWSLGFRPEK